jgi:hypothetical protein
MIFLYLRSLAGRIPCFYPEALLRPCAVKVRLNLRVRVTAAFSALLFAFVPDLTAQETAKVSWSVPAFEQKVFIENKGQFDGISPVGPKVLYGADDRGTGIYFTEQGLFYSLPVGSKTPGADEKATREAYERGIRPAVKPVLIHMRWLNANPQPSLIVEEKTTDYYNYGLPDGRHIDKAYGYKRLVYKDLYPGIDVEYTFHREKGIKYSLLLRPGADPSVIRMQYTNSGGLRADQDGNIRISTPAGDITDHAPVSFYADGKRAIGSSFFLEQNSVGFRLTPYDSDQAIVIDPWTTNPAFPSHNKGFKIDVDRFGNVYVYGSNTPFKLRKYSPAGIPLWTFITPWSSDPNWFGTIAVDSLGNTFVSSGTSDASMKKIDPNGIQLLDAVGTPYTFELYHMVFSKKEPNVIGLVGAEPPSTSGAAHINTLTGSVFGMSSVSGLYVTGESRGVCASSNCNFYTTTTYNPPGNIRCFLGFTFNFTNLFVAQSYDNLDYLSPVYKEFTYGGANKWNPPGSQNSISASYHYVYTFDGLGLKKFDACTGDYINGTGVPDANFGENSGVFADECDFIYVGSKKGVYKYDTDLNLVSFALTNGEVYDVTFNYSTGEMVACGNGMVASVNMNTVICTPPSVCACTYVAPVAFGLLSLEAVPLAPGAVKVIWTVTGEEEGTSYTVERSADGKTFDPAAELKGSAIRGASGTYEITDPRPLPGTSYYRLLSRSGEKTSYSGTVAVHRGREASGIFPNPVNAGKDLHLPAPAERTLVRILTTEGTEVYSRHFEPQEAGIIPTGSLSGGVYVVEISSGPQIRVQKLIVY